jgi:Flp pilus assembly protein TadG
MKPTMKSFLLRIIRDERGQVVPLMAAGLLIALLGLTAITVDLGRVYLAFRQLQAQANAAALAGAQALPNTTATTQATTYSGVSGSLNAYSTLPGVTMASGYPKVECLTTLANEGIACYSPAGGNAVQVQETVSVRLYFASLLGAPSVPLTATATASARGAIAGPFNVVILLDTTESMSQPAGTSECPGSSISCAISGIQTLLQELAPCAASATSCTVNASGVATNSVDNVSLFTFPNMTTTTVANDTDCSGSSTPTIAPYTFPSATGTTYTSNPEIVSGSTVNMTYEVTSFLSNYRTGDTATSLNPNSALSAAVGVGSGCSGMSAPGGESTYYAGAIYAAQGALAAEKVTYPAAQNVLIMLSDGDASAKAANLASKSQVPTGALYAEENGSGVYPSVNAQCTQAVTAAEYATAQGTRVYAVAYSPETSGCTTGDKLNPCQTMQAIASAAQYFYADTNQSGSASCSSVNDTTSLQGIFSSIGNDFTYARLIPNGTT